MKIELRHPQALDLIGFIPEFLFESDPRPAAEQFNERYAHGGGWSPLRGWEMDKECNITYPGDETLEPVAMIEFREELIFIYQYSWVAILQKQGDVFEVARMD